MKISKRVIYLLAITICFAACNTQKIANKKEETSASTENNPPIPDNIFSFSDTTSLVLIDDEETEKAYVIASLEKTACYGKCPVYQAKVFSNGLVLFDGKENTDKQGLFEAYIVQSQIDVLIGQADSIDFFSMSSAYPTNGFKIYDLPSTQTFIRRDEDEKTIVNNHNAPKNLRSYENYFEQFLSQLDWKKVEEDPAN